MQHHLLRTIAALAIAAGMATTAQATASETSLGTTLGGLSNWTLVGSDSYAFASLGARAGSTLTFTLVGESTAWNDSQTFAVRDGAATHLIFAGADAAGKTSTYAVSGLFDGIKFNSNSGVSTQTAPGGSGADFEVYQSKTNANLYALAYEDYRYGTFNDHNDMVITMAVAAVPEPGTYALMMVGLLALTAAARSRRRG